MYTSLSLVMKERKKYEAIVRELGGEALERNDVTVTWQQRVTHLAMPAFIRSQQVCGTLPSVLACTPAVHVRGSAVLCPGRFSV